MDTQVDLHSGLFLVDRGDWCQFVVDLQEDITKLKSTYQVRAPTHEVFLVQEWNLTNCLLSGSQIQYDILRIPNNFSLLQFNLLSP
jgi:hypothetical protein